MQLLKNNQEVDTLIASGNPVLFYKNSTQCDISAQAMKEITAFEPEAVNTHIVQVNVIEDREVSNHIENTLGVKHESPQAILVKNGEVLWTGSHYDVNMENLKTANKLTFSVS